jgi:ABC-type sugar transport system permease subunit
LSAAKRRVLLLPFLAVYGPFLVYPFFKGIWISLHDWNLFAVAFNPGAKEFIGTENYVRVFGGGTSNGDSLPARSCKPLVSSGSGWPFWATARGVTAGNGACARDRGGACSSCCRGFIPARTVAGMTAASGPRSATRSLFVGLAVPGVTITALLLAAALNRRDARKAPAHDLLPQPGVVGDGGDADLADHVLAPPGPDRQRDQALRRLAHRLAHRSAVRHGGHRDHHDLVVAWGSR